MDFLVVSRLSSLFISMTKTTNLITPKNFILFLSWTILILFTISVANNPTLSNIPQLLQSVIFILTFTFQTLPIPTTKK